MAESGFIDIANHLRIVRENVNVERARCAELADQIFHLAESTQRLPVEIIGQILDRLVMIEKPKSATPLDKNP